jgi:hypothetical protein
VDGPETVVFGLVVGARFLVPLLILRFPLPAVLASLVLDAADQSVFQRLGYNPPGYQAYDKAMDVYYLALAYLATMRNWRSESAYEVARFLYFYRLVGVAAFELSHWRPFLLIFPNTFEYFFIAYEAVRSRWDPTRFGLRFWLWTAGSIWIVVKLPQEYWVHIAQRDFTDTLAEVPWFGPVLLILAGTALVLFWTLVRPRLRPADWPPRFVADPLPTAAASASQRATWAAAHARAIRAALLEKIVLMGLLSLIFAQVVPDARLSTAQVVLAAVVLVVVNAALSAIVARRHRSPESILVALAIRAAVNCGLVFVFLGLITSGEPNRAAAVFFSLLLSVIIGLHDRYRSVHDARIVEASPRAPAADTRQAGAVESPGHHEVGGDLHTE